MIDMKCRKIHAWMLLVVINASAILLVIYTYRFPNSSQQIITSSGHDPPLLTLFTSMGDEKFFAQKYVNTLDLWPKINRQIVPVLFTDHKILVETAKEKGWRVLPIPRKAPNGLPYLKDMFIEVADKFESVFYGFANADMLFDDTLVDTLVCVGENIVDNEELYKNLIIGQRRNYIVDKEQKINEISEVARIFRSESTQFGTNTEDYLISTRNGYPWKEAPDLVLARPGLDNWFVYDANVRNIFVIDASKTIHALHQSSQESHYNGFAHSDADFNREKFPSLGFNAYMGTTDCAELETEFQNDVVTLIQKKTKICSGI